MSPRPSPSSKLLEAVAQREGISRQSLPPLYETIDPVVLDRFVATVEDDDAAILRFSYAGYEITLTADGELTVTE